MTSLLTACLDLGDMDTKMSKIKVIENFVSEEDRVKIISVIEELMKTVDVDPTADGYDSRFIFFRPEDPFAVEYVKKYAAKSQENYDYAPDTYIHDVIFAKSFPGAYLDVHMDFDHWDQCSECTHASVMYLNKDYEGSEIFFPKLEERYSPNPGTVVLFPQDDEDYVHGVTTLESGERYMINMCFTKDKSRQFDIYK